VERVAFLVEDSGEHILCLLNPETVTMTRAAGVEPRTVSGGRLTGARLADDPLLFTGGGRTELRLDLLFDVDLVATPAQRPQDVRQLTRPLWRLAENSTEDGGRRRPPSVRFVWGRAWNVPGVVVELAERFDRFTAGGAPLRSWLRLAFVRVGSAADEPGGEAHDYLSTLPPVDLSAPPVGAVLPVEEGGDPDRLGPVSPRELGLMSYQAFGTPLWWKLLMTYNGLDDPLQPSGPLEVPPLTGGSA
jgi:Contractile injection system tube protein